MKSTIGVILVFLVCILGLLISVRNLLIGMGWIKHLVGNEKRNRKTLIVGVIGTGLSFLLCSFLAFLLF